MFTNDESVRQIVSLVFEKYDLNNNGYLEMPEIAAYVNDAMKVQEKREATDEEIRIFLQSVDLDCDQKVTKMDLFKVLKLNLDKHWIWSLMHIIYTASLWQH